MSIGLACLELTTMPHQKDKPVIFMIYISVLWNNTLFFILLPVIKTVLKTIIWRAGYQGLLYWHSSNIRVSEHFGD